MQVEIITEPGVELPKYAHVGDAGMDIRAHITEPIVLKPLERALIPTGIKVNLPEGTEMQVRPRSGLAIKKGITVLNAPGTVDSGYQGDIGIILINLSNDDYKISNADRIAQLVFARFESVSYKQVALFETSERGSDGFGSTGHN